MKTEQPLTTTKPGIVYSQYASRQVAGEHCVAVHGLSYVLAGSLRVTEAGASQEFGAGSLLFARKNSLAKFTKQPTDNGPFQAITVVFDQALLCTFRQQDGGGGSSLFRPVRPSPTCLPDAPPFLQNTATLF